MYVCMYVCMYKAHSDELGFAPGYCSSPWVCLRGFFFRCWFCSFFGVPLAGGWLLWRLLGLWVLLGHLGFCFLV